MFGYDRQRTRFLPSDKVKPPFERRWKYGDSPLLEFPPIFVRAPELCVKEGAKAGLRGPPLLRQQQRAGVLARRQHRQDHVAARDRRPERDLPRLLATGGSSSPTSSRARPSASTRRPARRSGSARCPAAPSPRLWSSGSKVFFGCECGSSSPLNTKTGKTQWSTALGGEIKAAPAYQGGILYVGNYSGMMSAVKAANGEGQVAVGLARPQPRRAPAPSTPPRRSPSAASTAATTTAGSTPSTPDGRAGLDLLDRQLRLLGHRGRRHQSTPSRPSTSARSTATSTRSTPRPASRAGSSRQAGP